MLDIRFRFDSQRDVIVDPTIDSIRSFDRSTHRLHYPIAFRALLGALVLAGAAASWLLLQIWFISMYFFVWSVYMIVVRSLSI